MTKRKKIILALVGGLLLLAVIGTLLHVFLLVLPKQRERQALEEQIRAYYQAKLAQYAEENERYAPHEVDVAFLGDSLTDGYDVAHYYPQYLVSNRGISGETTFGLEARLQASVYDLSPKVAVILIGANNMDTMMENYEDILTGIKENLPDTEIVVLSLTSMSREWGKKNQLAAYNNVKIKKLAEKYSYTYVDMYSPLLNLETGEIYEEYTTDGGHLTDKGYEVFTSTLTPFLDEILRNYASTEN